MTGFARIQGQTSTANWTWEVRAVNGRGLDVRFRLPGFLSHMEEGLRKQVRNRLKRGNLQISLQLEQEAKAETGVFVNLDLAREIAVQFAPLIDQGLVRRPSVDGLLAVRGVLERNLQVFEAEPLEKPLIADFEQLLDHLLEVRASEGQGTFNSLATMLARIEELVRQCRNNPALEPDAILKRLHDQVKALGETISPERLAQEAALLAVKLDVNEELDRLESHLSAAYTLLEGSEGAVGRKLEFLTQEFSREANTLCAKSNNQQLTEVGLELKTLIDQIKEQAANVE